mgnify:CR=1 FL=1
MSVSDIDIDSTLSSTQPFVFTKEFTKHLQDLELLKTVDHIKEQESSKIS